MKKNLSKMVALVMMMSMCFATNNFAFAGAIDTKDRNLLLENVNSQKDVNLNIQEDKEQFTIKGDGTNFVIPKDGDMKIQIGNTEKTAIKVGLPNDFKHANGKLSKNGAVTYYSDNSFITVQALKQLQNGIVFDGLRSIITIDNPSAQKIYNFEYNLPDGFKLTTAKEYSGADTGEVYILDGDNNITAVIDPIMAVDSKGSLVGAHYEVNGNILSQVIDNEENSQYPITITSTTHPDKVTTTYLTKAMTKNYIDVLGTTDKADIARVATMIGVGLLPGGAPVSTLAGIADLWAMYNKYKVQELYEGMKSNEYLKITIIATWRNGGQNSGYVYNSPQYKVVKESEVPADILKKLKG